MLIARSRLKAGSKRPREKLRLRAMADPDQEPAKAPQYDSLLSAVSSLAQHLAEEQQAEVMSLAQDAREKLREAGLLQARVLLELRAAGALHGPAAKYLRDQFVYTAVAERAHSETKEVFRDFLRLDWGEFDESLRSQLLNAWCHTLGATSPNAPAKLAPMIAPGRLHRNASTSAASEPQWLEGLLLEQTETPESANQDSAVEPQDENHRTAAMRLMDQFVSAAMAERPQSDAGTAFQNYVSSVRAEFDEDLKSHMLQVWRPVTGASWARSPVQVHFPCDRVGTVPNAWAGDLD